MPKTLADIVVLTLAAKRVTRLVTTDWIGEWLLVRPAKKWAYDREGEVDVHMETVDVDGKLTDPTKGFWRTKAVSGMDCDWCVGVWVGTLLTVPLPKPLASLRQLLLPGLAVSQLVGMLAQVEHQLADRVEHSMHTVEDPS